MTAISVETYLKRRKQLQNQLKSDDIAVISAAFETTRSLDTEYLFRQDSYFYYLTGFNEPDALLVLLPEQSILFCRNKDRMAEIWQGRRIGAERAQKKYLFEQAYPLSELDQRLPELLNSKQALWYADGLYPQRDRLLDDLFVQLRGGEKKGWKAPTIRRDIRPVLNEMRLIKDEQEIAMMRKATQITASAHCRAMEKAHPGMMEYQLEAEIHHEFARKGARFPAYNTIVGAGENACILHYTENQDVMAGGELILIDAGCEYGGYAADITRTFPANGLFSEEQKALYQIVLDAQLAAIEQVKPGSSFDLANQAAIRVIVKGLVKLGILEGDVEQLIAENAQKEYFMHGIGHWLGLDTHDVGDYHRENNRPLREFQPGMVLTIEPGLYIDEEAKVDAKWQNIGIRIEDNLLITADGHEMLTSGVPKEISEIESLMGKTNASRGAITQA